MDMIFASKFVLAAYRLTYHVCVQSLINSCSTVLEVLSTYIAMDSILSRFSLPLY